MVRGTFGSIRLRNELVPGREGDVTVDFTTGEVTSILEAAERYRTLETPLLVIAGREYGTGSSRDWAAKGTRLLGVRAVVAESFERTHRANLVGMGVLPLQFRDGEGRVALGLSGAETFDVLGIAGGIAPDQPVTIRASRADGSTLTFITHLRLDSAIEVAHYEHGGILPYVLRQLTGGVPATA
jgi:aconitate hydratase